MNRTAVFLRHKRYNYVLVVAVVHHHHHHHHHSGGGIADSAQLVGNEFKIEYSGFHSR
jgi:hypothetical protein